MLGACRLLLVHVLVGALHRVFHRALEASRLMAVPDITSTNKHPRSSTDSIHADSINSLVRSKATNKMYKHGLVQAGFIHGAGAGCNLLCAPKPRSHARPDTPCPAANDYMQLPSSRTISRSSSFCNSHLAALSAVQASLDCANHALMYATVPSL